MLLLSLFEIIKQGLILNEVLVLLVSLQMLADIPILIIDTITFC